MIHDRQWDENGFPPVIAAHPGVMKIARIGGAKIAYRLEKEGIPATTGEAPN